MIFLIAPDSLDGIMARSVTPFLTIIVATYNGAKTLPQLLESLSAQACRDFEIIIQDGASSDETVAVAESFRNNLPALSIASEPDSGIYDAWNKALLRVRGEWLLFLGADDELADKETLALCANSLSSFSGAAVYAGGSVETIGLDGMPVSVLPYLPGSVDKSCWRAMPFPHQGLWHRRSLFEGNQFDSSLRIVADFDFVCRTWTLENGNAVLPFIITRMHRGGISDQPSSVLRMRWELATVAARYFPDVWTASCVKGLAKGCLLWFCCAILGKRTAAVLDAGRKLRGLPPAWKGL